MKQVLSVDSHTDETHQIVVTSAEPVIQFNGVSKYFSVWLDRPQSIKALLTQFSKFRFNFGHKQKTFVLQDISLKINKGDFVGIMGRNGVGKSTLLKLISKILLPSGGSIEVKGRIIPLLELGAGFISDLTGYENVFLNASILGFSRDEANEKIDEIIKFADLGDHIYEPVRNYSSGMLVRLGFAVAAHFNADILLFDEVLAVGDVGFQKKCLDKITELYRSGRTIVLVTHDPSQVVEQCNRCIVIEKAGVVFDGDPQQGVQVYKQVFVKQN